MIRRTALAPGWRSQLASGSAPTRVWPICDLQIGEVVGATGFERRDRLPVLKEGAAPPTSARPKLLRVVTRGTLKSGRGDWIRTSDPCA